MKKEKKVTYFIHINKAGEEFFDEKIDIVLSDIYRLFGRRDIEVVLIDENGISDSAMNEIAEQFIKSCMAKENRNYAIPRPKDPDEFCETVKGFIKKVFLYAYWERRMVKEDRYQFDIVAPNGSSFVVNIPKDLIGEDKHEEFLALGPDHLMGSLFPEDILSYIIPAYFFFLCEMDAFEDPSLGAFDLYMIGLH